MPLPHPQQVLDAGLDISHYSTAEEFRKFGGRTKMPPGFAGSGGRQDRFVVVAMPATYDPEVDVPNALEAISAYWRLFSQEGGWTVFVWDRQEKEGWSWDYVGPDFEDYIYEDMGLPVPGKPTADVNLLARVNRYRAQFGKQPLASGEWSDEDLEEFASNIPTPNPRRGRRRGPPSSSLKRKLMQ